jgi:hypothetical protein
VRIKNRDYIPAEDNVIKVDFGAKQWKKIWSTNHHTIINIK